MWGVVHCGVSYNLLVATVANKPFIFSQILKCQRETKKHEINLVTALYALP